MDDIKLGCLRTYYPRVKKDKDISMKTEFKEFLDGLSDDLFKKYFSNLIPYLLKNKKGTITEIDMMACTESLCSNREVSDEIIHFAFKAVSRHTHENNKKSKKPTSKQDKAKINFGIARSKNYFKKFLNEYYELPADFTYEFKKTSILKSLLEDLKALLKIIKDKDDTTLENKTRRVNELIDYLDNFKKVNVVQLVSDLTELSRLLASLDNKKHLLKRRNSIIKEIVKKFLEKVTKCKDNEYIIERLEKVYEIVNREYDEDEEKDVNKHFSSTYNMNLQDALSFGRFLSDQKHENDKLCFHYLRLYVFGKPKISEYAPTFLTACVEHILTKLICDSGEYARKDPENQRNTINMNYLHRVLEENQNWKYFIQSIYQDTTFDFEDQKTKKKSKKSKKIEHSGSEPEHSDSEHSESEHSEEPKKSKKSKKSKDDSKTPENSENSEDSEDSGEDSEEPEEPPVLEDDSDDQSKKSKKKKKKN